MTGVGLTYEGEPDSEWDRAPFCTVHNAYEMFHTCAGGPGEPLGYCAKAANTTDCQFRPKPRPGVAHGPGDLAQQSYETDFGNPR